LAYESINKGIEMKYLLLSILLALGLSAMEPSDSCIKLWHSAEAYQDKAENYEEFIESKVHLDSKDPASALLDLEHRKELSEFVSTVYRLKWLSCEESK